MGDTRRRVSASTGSVGEAITAQGAELRSTWGYQVSTMRRRNIKLQAASSNPRTGFRRESTWSKVGVTNLKAIAKTS